MAYLLRSLIKKGMHRIEIGLVINDKIQKIEDFNLSEYNINTIVQSIKLAARLLYCPIRHSLSK
jgi:hypothetical protein